MQEKEQTATAKDSDGESGSSKRFTLRMDSKLFETVSALAKRHKRSVAKEMEYALEIYTSETLRIECLNAITPKQ